jgi:precorrin-6A/cobalt-precorrin-6A reductase
MRGKRILVLGGTAEARALAAALIKAGHGVVTSLAGVTQNPMLPEGALRVGGFGGEPGLHDYLLSGNFDVLVDAAHPFAVRISRNACNAALRAGIPLLRLGREPWARTPGDRWMEVAGVEGAVAALPPGARIMLTIGRKDIGPFVAREDLSGVARMIEAPAMALASRWKLLLARPPFSLEGEKSLFERERITHLVTKNAGGEMTEAKLLAARELQIAVVMIARPRKPAAQTCATVEELVAALL